MIHYSHTNLIAKDASTLIRFYKTALECRSIGETRDLSGEWLDRLTGIPNAHITGEHLALPGYEGQGPTLEIFSYDHVEGIPSGLVNAAGFAHLAFEVDNVPAALKCVLACGGGQIGELVQKTYADGRTICVVYATDPEGNILELQSWS